MKLPIALWSAVILAVACAAEAANLSGSGQEELIVKAMLNVIKNNKLFGAAAKPLKMDDPEIVSLQQSLTALAGTRKSGLSECSQKSGDGSGTDPASAACRCYLADEASLKFMTAYLNDRGYRTVSTTRFELETACGNISTSACNGSHGVGMFTRTICQELKKQSKTKDELEAALFGAVTAADRHLVHDAFGQLLQAASVENNSAVNRIYLKAQFPVQQSYVDVLKDCYGSDLLNVEFNEPTRHRINEFVENSTRGLIKDLLPEGAIDSSTNMVLINAIFFKGSWQNPFDVEMTKQGTFYIGDDEILVPMMQNDLEIRHSFSATLDADLLLLPYTTGKVAMMVILPRQRLGLSGLVNKLTNSLIETAWHEAKVSTVTLVFPMFKTMTTAGDIRNSLISLGVKQMFGASANFTKMSQAHLQVSAVFHKAFVEVDERGTTAAAATGGVGSSDSMQMPYVLRCDHGFLYLIVDQSTCDFNILFVGQLTNPTA